MADALIALDRFLARAAESQTVWGSWDCHLWLADWVLAARGGGDPASGYRGRYRTPLGALRLLHREGGSEDLVARLAARADLEEACASSPAAGDVGLLPCVGSRGLELIGGLYTGRRWAVLGHPSGLIAHTANASRIWRVL